MKIAILMTCYNRSAVTLRSLMALQEAAKRVSGIEVFLVDDASPDGSGAKIKDSFPNVNVIQGTGGLYWAKSMRLAWETASAKADYDFYLWLNDDLMLKPEAVSCILDDFSQLLCSHPSSFPHPVVVGFCSEDETETVCSYGVTDDQDRIMTPNGCPQRAMGWLNGNFILVPRSVFQKVGMISGEYSHARADYDYAERLKKAGIPFFGSSKFVGVCHNDFAERMRSLSLWRRIQMLWRPSHWNLHDLWIIRRRYHGVAAAVVSCAHLVLVAIIGVK